MSQKYGEWVCTWAKCGVNYKSSMLEERVLLIPIYDQQSGEVSRIDKKYLGKISDDQDCQFTLMKTAQLVKTVEMQDGSEIKLGYESLLQAINAINTEATDIMENKMSTVTLEGISHAELRASGRYPYSEDPRLSRKWSQ